MNILISHLCFLLLVCQSLVPAKGQELKLNQIQLIGSHNSYKIGIERPLMDLIQKEDPETRGLDYAHISMPDQLDLGLRGFELDVLYDPEGGRFAYPAGLQILDSMGIATEPYDAERMKDPGFKVLHIPDIDFRSHCPTFKGCLSDIREWSQSHSDHLPIIITINPKSSGVNKPGFSEVIPFDRQVLDALDREILEIFDTSELITPQLVKGNYKSLKNAVLKQGWPELTAVRGKVLFVLDSHKALTEVYLKDDEDYARPMFANADIDHPHAAFFIMNDPIRHQKEIADRVRQGFMVRTRSDANTVEARSGDKSRFRAALRSGAQLITTDYYLKSLSPGQDFEIVFDDGSYSQCNPVTRSSDCEL